VDPASAPVGGVSLPINAAAGGTLTAKGLVGDIRHEGGTQLFRGAGKSKPPYTSPLRDLVFGFTGTGVNSLSAFIVNINAASTIGSVTGQPVATLTDAGGSVSLTGDLVLSDVAAGNLAQDKAPLGAACPTLAAGDKIGNASTTANVV
jgi:hypothetical protein